MLQKGQKSLLKGITAVTRILHDKGNNPASSAATIMKTLSGRRGTLLRSDMKIEYRLLCSDQNPVEDGLLFGTELGKSVKDLSEASKVTAKLTLKQKRSQSSHTFQGQSEVSRPFPFLGRGRRAIAKKRGRYRNPPQSNQPPYQPGR